jgi:hypothetical protein
MTGPAPDPIATAQDLTGALRSVAAEVSQLRKYGRHNRAFILVDVLLTVLLSGVGAISVHAVQSAGQANSAQLALCQAGNVARTQQLRLWDHLLSLPPAPGAPKRSPAQVAQLAAFRAYVDSVFKPRDCATLGKNGH